MDPNPSSLCGLLAEGRASGQCQGRGGIFPGHGIGEGGGCEGARSIYGSGNVTTQVQVQAQGTSLTVSFGWFTGKTDCVSKPQFPTILVILSLSTGASDLFAYCAFPPF